MHDAEPVKLGRCQPAEPIFVAPFDELAEPGRVLDLAVRAEDRGWDGFFVWDHVGVPPRQSRALADPWVTLAAIAAAHRDA